MLLHSAFVRVDCGVQYFRRKETDAKRQQMKRTEMDRCLKTRAAQSFFLDGTVRQHSLQDQKSTTVVLYCLLLFVRVYTIVSARGYMSVQEDGDPVGDALQVAMLLQRDEV